MNLTVIPFETGMLEEAAQLLAQRHRRDRQTLRVLPEEFEEPARAFKAVETLWGRETASGAAAVRGGKLVGYLIGEELVHALWGRTAWVRPAGLALAGGEDLELVRDLYAWLSRDWVRSGFFDHFAVMPLSDPALPSMWFRLSFGIEQVQALQELKPPDPASIPLPPGVQIRRAGPGDEEALGRLSDVIWKQVVQAPVWGIHLPEAGDRSGWAELASDPDVTVWLAVREGEVVGSVGSWQAQTGAEEIWIPDRCATLSVAGTREGYRGMGIGSALTRWTLAQMYAQGFRYSETDWRSANLLADRFWPRFGYQPVGYRLSRRIDRRIAWANFER